MKGNESLANICLCCKNLVEQTEKIPEYYHTDFHVGHTHTYKMKGVCFSKHRICAVTGQDVYDAHVVKCSHHIDTRKDLK